MNRRKKLRLQNVLNVYMCACNFLIYNPSEIKRRETEDRKTNRKSTTQWHLIQWYLLVYLNVHFNVVKFNFMKIRSAQNKFGKNVTHSP